MVSQKIVLFWFRRDLRLDDNHALYRALSFGLPVLPLFIFDQSILEELPSNDKRVALIYNRLKQINSELKKFGSSCLVEQGIPHEIFNSLSKKFQIKAVYTNEDYEPYAIERDKKIEDLLSQSDIDFFTFQDQVLVHPKRVNKKDKTPYSIFTPWSKQWKKQFDPDKLTFYPSEKLLDKALHIDFKFPNIAELGFKEQSVQVNLDLPDKKLLQNYNEARNYPSQNGTSRLSVALRFGMISVRKLAKKASASPTYINELGWREFYMMILYNFPHVVTQSFKTKYDNIQWRNNSEEFERWKNGETGYAIVDAGMRQLFSTGYMHNRVRMITASFLTKHLLIDWRWGESWFAEKLLDYELASNNGGWQWAAGTGCDAAPYFRIFNPAAQTKKFDSEVEFVRKWVPEFDSLNYSSAIVDHKFARERALETYKRGLQ